MFAYLTLFSLKFTTASFGVRPITVHTALSRRALNTNISLVTETLLHDAGVSPWHSASPFSHVCSIATSTNQTKSS